MGGGLLIFVIVFIDVNNVVIITCWRDEFKWQMAYHFC